MLKGEGGSCRGERKTRETNRRNLKNLILHELVTSAICLAASPDTTKIDVMTPTEAALILFALLVLAFVRNVR